MATHKDGIWVTPFYSLSPMHTSLNNLTQLCFMSQLGSQLQGLLLCWITATRIHLTLIMWYFTCPACWGHMYFWVFTVFSKRPTLAHGSFRLLILCCTAVTPPFYQLFNTSLFCFHCQLVGADWSGSSSAQQLLTHMWSINPGSGKAKCSRGKAFH